MMRDGALFVRVSSEDQHPEIYLPEMHRWADARGVNVVKVFMVQDSASNEGKARGKGALFDAARDELVEGARMGHWNTTLIWNLNRLSRRGYKDLSAVIDQLREYDCELWSHEEEWLQTVGPFGEIVVHMLAWMAENQMKELSNKVKLGMVRAKANGVKVGGRRPGSRNKHKVVHTDAIRAKVAASWTEERRAALAARNAARAATLAA
jgi:DNA invertase Pin-like site-specific DNA recombinase